jgi:hypothetical protein
VQGPRPRCGEAECGGAEEDKAGHGQQEEGGLAEGGGFRESVGTERKRERVPAGGDERLLSVLPATVALVIGQPNTDGTYSRL